VDLFTPLSTGKVNVNTASASVLMLIPGFGDNTNVAEGIISARSQAPLQNIGELINVPGVTQAILAQASPFIDVRSHTFEVTTTVEWGGYKQDFITVLGRLDAQHIKVLSFTWKDREAQGASPPQ
jgi:type II secretory pathway component PulK